MTQRILRTLRLFLLWFGALLASTASVAEPVGFDWLQAPSADLTVDQIRAFPDHAWTPARAGEVLNQGVSDDVFWLRVRVPAEPANRLLEVGYPLLDEVSVFWERNGEIIEHHHTGDTRPFSSRPIYHRKFVFLVPSNTEDVTAYLRVHTEGSVQVPVAVTRSAQFLENEQLSYGWQTTFLGIVLALALYNLFLFTIVRDATYLWYVLTVVTTGLLHLNFNGLLFQWLWPESPWLNRYFTLPAIGLGLVFATVFTMKFLSVRQYSPASFRFLQILLGLSVLCTGFGLLGSYAVGFAVASILAVIMTVSAWFIGLLVWRRGEVMGGFYVLAWSLLLMGHLVLAVSKIGLMPRSLFTELAPQAGVALEAVLLSFALAYRINTERRERLAAQEQALEVQRQANLTLESRVKERTEALEQAYEQLKAVSLTDGLTHLANRRRFDDRLNAEWSRALRQGEPLGLVMIDIDFFKKVNDEYGHLVGDDCLVAVAGRLQSEIQRSGDLVARYGGEEFVVLLPSTPAEGAYQVAERLRQAVERTPIHSGERVAPIRLTISAGVAAMMPRRDLAAQELIRRADDALYAAKQAGRNRVMVYRDRGPAAGTGA